jgi:hypothetical protein
MDIGRYVLFQAKKAAVNPDVDIAGGYGRVDGFDADNSSKKKAHFQEVPVQSHPTANPDDFPLFSIAKARELYLLHPFCPDGVRPYLTFI